MLKMVVLDSVRSPAIGVLSVIDKSTYKSASRLIDPPTDAPRFGAADRAPPARFLSYRTVDTPGSPAMAARGGGPRPGRGVAAEAPTKFRET